VANSDVTFGNDLLWYVTYQDELPVWPLGAENGIFLTTPSGSTLPNNEQPSPVDDGTVTGDVRRGDDDGDGTVSVTQN